MPNLCILRRAGLVLVSLLLPTLVSAQQPPASQSIGIVTAIQGQAVVSRATLPQPQSLHFKDDVFFRDQIGTRERSTVRLLLGGKGTLTIREQSQVTLDESATPDGGRRSILSLLSGKIGAAIAHALMRPGDVVEIHTPNAVAAVRGTVLVAEYIPPQGHAATSRPVVLASAAAGPVLAQAPGVGGTSTFLVISGQISITPQGLLPVTLGTLQTISITQTATGLQMGPVQNVTPAQAAERVKDLQVGRPATGEAGSGKVAQAQAQIAAAVANVIIQKTTGQAVVATTPVTATTSTTATTTTSVTPPPTATSSVSSGSESGAASSGGARGGGTAGGTSGGGGGGTPNPLANGPLLTPTNINLALADGISLATFTAGTANTVTPLTLRTGVLSAPPLLVTGNPITHSGTIVRMSQSTLNSATGSAEAPLVVVNGTNLTNTGGPVFDVRNSSVSSFWPVFQLESGASATVAGVMNIAGQSKVNVGPHDAVLLHGGSALTSTDVLFQLGGNSELLSTGGAALVDVDPGALTLQAPILSASGSTEAALLGPALNAVDSAVTSTQPLVFLQGNSNITGAGPLVLMNGGSLTADSIVKAQGSPSINLNGGILDLTNATASFRTILELDGATVNLLGTGNAIRIDTATLNASATIINMINSSFTTSPGGDPLNGAIHVLRGNITSNGPVFGLSNSTLTVQNGPLLSLTNGSQMTVNGDFASLRNSVITVLNGPLIFVDGRSSTGLQSSLTVTGALANLNNTVRSQLIVNNSIPTTGSTSGIPFHASGGSTITIGPNPITNASDFNAIKFNGSVIQATNGGRIDIRAP